MNKIDRVIMETYKNHLAHPTYLINHVQTINADK